MVMRQNFSRCIPIFALLWTADATVTLERTVVGNLRTECKQFAIILPFKWLLQRWRPDLRPLRFDGCYFESNLC